MFFSTGEQPSRTLDLPTQTDPQLLRERAIRRARTAIRRYIVSNALVNLWGLTFSRQTDLPCSVPAGVSEGGGWCACGRPVTRDAALSVVPEYIRRLRDAWWRGEAHPYVVVPEPHKDGHWHAHIALAGFVPWQIMERVWGHGNVGIRSRGGNPAVRQASTMGDRQPSRTELRKVGSYLSKYLGKSLGDQVDGVDLEGRQRYRVAEGFNPQLVERIVHGKPGTDGLAQALRVAMRSVTGEGSIAWHSDGDDEWPGPRTFVLTFGDPS